MSIKQSYNNALAGFAPIRLAQMDSVKLMNRVDTKFIFHDSLLREVLLDVRDDYSVLEIDGKRIFGYESAYLDTPEFAFYKQHHNGKPRRIKLRYRTYKDSGDVFFEVKKRRNPLRTHKHRVLLEDVTESIGETEQNFLADCAVLGYGELEHKLSVEYNRITLVANDGIERVTIDVGLCFGNSDSRIEQPHLVIVEVKQDRFSRLSPFVTALRKHRIKEHSLSKYVLGVVLLHPQLKHNAFKGKLRAIEHILGDTHGYY
ncbi:MAG: polyphosphate polymerase domain-containing protein [Bacteriodetes bacterium]|nr:polyphosphate polymerase domain-containing protein [Bacteroidota bacterium]